MTRILDHRLGIVAIGVALGLGVGACGGHGGNAAGRRPATNATPGTPTAAPAADPSRFIRSRSNSYFPLKPGTVTTLRGSDEDGSYVERVEITHETKTIQGVRCVVSSDVLRRTDGSLAEKTSDWYAGDDRGNVWYFGEDTGTYDKSGKLEDKEGSWEAGKDGGKPGLIMPAHPQPGQAYRQELHPGDAEDQAWIVSNDEHVSVPAGHFDHVVRSYEWSRLEPNVISLKYYAPGIGVVAEKDVAGGHEQFQLTSSSR